MSILKKANLLSLDVVAGAMLSSIAFWKLPDGTKPIPWLEVIALGLSVWIIYLADRLLDNSKPQNPTTERHIFQKKHQKAIVLSLFLSAFVLTILLFYIPTNSLCFGIVLVSIIGLYGFFVCFNRLVFLKEIAVILLYSIGVGGLPIYQKSTNIALLIAFVCVVALCLLVFAIFEVELEANNTNIAHKVGKKGQKITIILLLFTFIFLFSYCQTPYEKAFYVVLTLMNMVLIGLCFFRKCSFVQNNYRLIGEGVFLFTALLLGF